MVLFCSLMMSSLVLRSSWKLFQIHENFKKYNFWFIIFLNFIKFNFHKIKKWYHIEISINKLLDINKTWSLEMIFWCPSRFISRRSISSLRCWITLPQISGDRGLRFTDSSPSSSKPKKWTPHWKLQHLVFHKIFKSLFFFIGLFFN